MKLYIDLCCWNRPFDDAAQARIRAEAAALEVVLERIRQNLDQLAWSSYLDAELFANPHAKRRQWIESQKTLAAVTVTHSPVLETRGQALVQAELSALDALHLAAAEESAEYLLTVDDRFLRQARKQTLHLRVCNPVDYCDEVNRANS